MTTAISRDEYRRPLRSYLSLAEMVQILQDESVTVTDYAEADLEPPYTAHSIDFDGDYHDAMRVVMIALRYGFCIRSLHQNWSFDDNAIGKPTWRIMVYAAGRGDATPGCNRCRQSGHGRSDTTV